MTVAIVPAAGASSRMGRPKLLLPFGDTTVVGALLDTLHRAGVGRIVVVTASSDRPLRDWVSATGFEVATNPRPERGMLSSILAGIEALGGASAIADHGEPLLITPADLPAIRPATVRGLVAALEGAGSPLAVPVYRGRRGHPLAVAANLAPQIAALDPAVGLRQLLDRHAVLGHAVDDPGVVADIDTPSDYRTLQAGGADGQDDGSQSRSSR